MSWIEIIRICMGRGKRGDEGSGVLRTVERELAAVPGLEWGIYRHSSVPEDAMILLYWEGDPPDCLESDLAAALSRELKRYGLVDHSAWVNTAKRL